MSDNRKKIKTKELLDFTTNLSLLLNSGLSVYNSIQMINSFSSSKNIKQLTSFFEQGLKKGGSLSTLINKYESDFPPLYSGLISIGDRIGSLSTILPTLQTYLERNKKIRDKFINASIYPAIVLIMLCVGVLFLIFVGLPKIESLFAELAGTGSQLKAFSTKIAGLKISGLILLGLVFICVIIVILRKHFQSIKLKTDILLLRTPGISGIITTIDIFNFTFAVETLTKHGITLSAAILEARNVCSNEELKRIFTMVNNDLISGKSLYGAFSIYKYIPKQMIQWIGIGENTGQTETVFQQLRTYYESEIDNMTTRLLGIIEPALTIFVGAVIIYLILNFIVPLFSLFGAIA